MRVSLLVWNFHQWLINVGIPDSLRTQVCGSFHYILIFRSILGSNYFSAVLEAHRRCNGTGSKELGSVWGAALISSASALPFSYGSTSWAILSPAKALKNHETKCAAEIAADISRTLSTHSFYGTNTIGYASTPYSLFFFFFFNQPVDLKFTDYDVLHLPKEKKKSCKAKAKHPGKYILAFLRHLSHKGLLQWHHIRKTNALSPLSSCRELSRGVTSY